MVGLMRFIPKMNQRSFLGSKDTPGWSARKKCRMSCVVESLTDTPSHERSFLPNPPKHNSQKHLKPGPSRSRKRTSQKPPKTRSLQNPKKISPCENPNSCAELHFKLSKRSKNGALCIKHATNRENMTSNL